MVPSVVAHRPPSPSRSTASEPTVVCVLRRFGDAQSKTHHPEDAAATTIHSRLLRPGGCPVIQTTWSPPGVKAPPPALLESHPIMPGGKYNLPRRVHQPGTDVGTSIKPVWPEAPTATGRHTLVKLCVLKNNRSSDWRAQSSIPASNADNLVICHFPPRETRSICS
jgi:hypothetical protein